MKRGHEKAIELSRQVTKPGRLLAAGTAAVTLAMMCSSLPTVHADTTSNTSTTAQTQTQTQQSKLSQQDAISVITKQFPDLIAQLGSPTVSLQPDPLVASRSIYRMNWQPIAYGGQSGPRITQNYAYASVDANTGQIVQYQLTPSTWLQKSPISLAAAEKLAQGWVNKLAPKQAQTVVLTDKEQLSGGFSFLYVAKINGILAPFDSVHIQLTNDGQLALYSFSWEDANFPVITAPPITESEAEGIYQSHLKVALNYQQRYAPQGPGPMELVYQPVSNGSGTALGGGLPIIDATTGAEIAADGTPITPSTQTAAQTPIDANGPKDFPQPSKTPLTEDEITTQITKQLAMDGPGWILQNAQQSTSNGGNVLPSHPTWSLSYANSTTGASVSVVVDATDGVIINYNAYISNPQGSSPSSSTLASDQLQNAANAAVAKLYPNLLGAIVPVTHNFYGGPPNQAPFFYDFLVNGILVQGFQVMMDPTTGQIQNLFLQTDPSTVFPSPSLAIPSNTALSDFEKADGLVLQYMLPEQPTSPNQPYPLQYDSNAKLVYAPTPLADGLGTLNAITGKWEQFPLMGQSAVVPSNVQANASAQKKAISLLEQHGIITGSEIDSNGDVNASAIMTRGRFIAWLSRAYNMNISGTPAPQFTDVTTTTPYASDLSTALMQGWMNNIGMLHPNNALTRVQAAQWVVQWMGWQGPASHTAFYKVTFSDAKSVPQTELGAAVMMSQAGVLPLTNGKFLPNQQLTVGEAAVALAQAVQVFLTSN